MINFKCSPRPFKIELKNRPCRNIFCSVYRFISTHQFDRLVVLAHPNVPLFSSLCSTFLPSTVCITHKSEESQLSTNHEVHIHVIFVLDKLEKSFHFVLHKKKSLISFQTIYWKNYNRILEKKDAKAGGNRSPIK